MGMCEVSKQAVSCACNQGRNNPEEMFMSYFLNLNGHIQFSNNNNNSNIEMYDQKRGKQ